MIMVIVDIKELDNLHRLQKFRQRPNLLGPWHNLQRTQAPNQSETWSFDNAINEILRLPTQEFCPKPTEENTPAKPL